MGLILTASITVGIVALFTSSAPQSCTYADWTWSAAERRVVDARDVEKPYAALADDERDAATGCSICSEDQVEISLPGIAPFQICKAIADDMEAAMTRAMSAGFKIESVTGYRVGRSKGVTDAQGRRTQYSNHSFGLAIDVNPENNGLYDRCTRFSGNCRLIRGGEWRAGSSGAISPDTAVYREMKSIGWKWGGELPGQQKDFMHFSPSGD